MGTGKKSHMINIIGKKMFQDQLIYSWKGNESDDLGALQCSYTTLNSPFNLGPFAFGRKHHFIIKLTFNCVSVYNLQSLLVP